MNRIFRQLTLVTAMGTLLLVCSCNNEKYHKEVLDHMGKQVEEQKKMAAATDEAKDIAQDVSQKTAEDRKRIEALEKQLATQEEELNALKGTADELAKLVTTPKNVTAEGAADNGIALTVLTNPKIRALICPVLAELGGSKAEARLVELVSSDKDANVKTAAIKGLVEMKSTQIVKVLNGAMANASGEGARTVASTMTTHCDASSREPALAALKRLSGSNDYNDRYARQALFTVLSKVGTPKDFVVVEKYFTGETDSSTKASAFGALIALGQAHKEKIVTLAAANGELFRSNSNVMAKLTPYADVKLTDMLVIQIPKMGWSSRRSAYRLLATSKDPVAATFLVERYNGKESDGDCKRALKEIFQAKYPGIVWDIQKEKVSLAPDAELKKLIDARNRKISGATKAPAQP